MGAQGSISAWEVKDLPAIENLNQQKIWTWICTDKKKAFGHFSNIIVFERNVTVFWHQRFFVADSSRMV